MEEEKNVNTEKEVSKEPIIEKVVKETPKITKNSTKTEEEILLMFPSNMRNGAKALIEYLKK